MATAAEAAQAATEGAGSAEGAGADKGAQDGGTPQGGAAGAPGGDQAGAGSSGGAPGAGGQQPTTVKPPVSETVRLARELRRTQAKLAELERARPAGGTPPAGQPPATREAVMAELKRQYDEDPEGFLQAVAGEGFYDMARRVETRNAAPETRIQALERELAELKGTATNLVKDRETEAQRAADQQTERHIAEVAKEIEATDAEGNPKYPTLATLDPEVLDEPIALTAYNAVAVAWDKECRRVDEKTGKRVQFKEWTAAEVEDRFARAFKAMDTHYSKLRTPRSRNQGTQPTQDAEFAPTISTSTSSGHAERPEKHAPGTMPWEQAMRLALKEQGLS